MSKATKTTVKKGNTEPVSKTPAKKVAKPKVKPSKVKLVSFTVGAVIPTQQYGNIQPQITIEAPSIEEARGIVMPVIEEMIVRYAETKPGFLGRVEVKEKVVTPPAPEAPAPKAPGKPLESSSSVPVPALAPASQKQPESQTGSSPANSTETEKHPAVAKAEKAIALAVSKEAVDVIQKQIENSTKIPESFKTGLIEQCYKKWNELKSK